MTIAERSTAFPVIPHRPATRRRIASSSRQWLRPWLKRLQTFNAFISSMPLLVNGSTASHASETPTRVPFSASLVVSPTIGQINAPRLLTVTAHFPLGRGPRDATFSAVTLDGVQTLEVRFDMPSPDFAFSDFVWVPYTVEMTYSPSEAGDLTVRVMTSDGIPVGASVVMTRHAKVGVAQFDATAAEGT